MALLVAARPIFGTSMARGRHLWVIDGVAAAPATVTSGRGNSQGETSKLLLDVGSVGGPVLDLVEAKRLLPCFAGLVKLSARGVNLSQAGLYVGFDVGVAEITAQRQGLFVVFACRYVGAGEKSD